MITQTQDTLKREHDTHAIRVDVHLETPQETIVLEMQLSQEANLFWRMRFYQGILDTASLPQGQDYITLKESYIVFFCNFDPVGLDLPVYTVRQCYEEKHDKNHNDGTHKLLYNIPAWAKCENPEVRALLRYMDTGEITSELTKMIDRALKEEQRTQEWRNNFMTCQIMLDSRLEHAVNQRLEQKVEQRIAQIKPTLIAESTAQGMAQGIAQGRDEGAYEKAVSTARNFLAMGLSCEQVAQGVGLNVEEVRSLT